MALEDAITPEIKPLGSPTGRFDHSPLGMTTGDVTLEDLTLADTLAGEGAKVTGIPGQDPEKSYSPVGRHSQESTTFGTGTPAALSKNDPFGDL
jgi:hypothetical protein